MTTAIQVREPETMIEQVRAWRNMPDGERKRKAGEALQHYGQDTDQGEAAAHTLRDLLMTYVRLHGRSRTDTSPNTLAAYWRGARRFLDFCAEAGIKAHQAGEDDAAEFLTSMADLSPKSRQLYITAARTFVQALAWAGMGDPDDDPFDRVRVYESTERSEKVRYYRPADWKAMLEACDRQDPDRPVRAEHRARDRVIVRLGIDTGLRLAEMVGLRWSDVRAGQLHIRGKGGKLRTVPTTDNLEAALETLSELMGEKRSGRILEIGRNRVQQRVANLCERAEIEHLGVHALRHTFAMRHVRQGITPPELQKLLGHSSVTTTMIYWHVEPEDLQTAQGRLNGDPELEDE